MSATIRTEALTKHYGRFAALEELTLEVPAGTVFGYLGPNGAGKTTTIRLLLGLLRPTSGRAELLGLDVLAQRGDVHRRAGYLPGDFSAYRDLTGEQYLTYLANLRGGVERASIDVLAKRLDLDLGRRIHALSRGNRQKVGLVQAFMHRPDVLILDEPSSGLDPLVHREFLAMLREARDAGQTVFLSSHVLSEVEAIADSVGILRRGRLVAVESIAALRSKALRRMDLTFVAEPPAAVLHRLNGVRDITVAGRTVHLTVEGSLEGLLKVVAPYGVQSLVSHEADLEDVFLTYYADGE